MRFCRRVLWGIIVVALAILSLGGFLVSLEILPRIVILGALTALEQQLLTKGIFVWEWKILRQILNWLRRG